MSSNLLLFGCDLSRDRKASELNFWHDLTAYLSKDFSEIVIVSINNRNIRKEYIPPNITLYNLPPVYFRNNGDSTDKEYTGPRYHKLPLSVIYKTITLIRYRSVIRDIVEKHNIGIIHYVRIFGILNKVLKRKLSHVSFTMTVPTHVDRGFPLHYIYHQIKIKGFAGMNKLIATTKATAERLTGLGIDEENIEVIPWSAENNLAQKSGNPGFRKRLAVAPDAEIILWSGPLQGTGGREIEYAVQVAHLVTRQTEKFHFVFAFKPDKLKAEYFETLDNNKRVSVLETNQADFKELQNIAALFLSPICDKNRTVAPPLTWIEIMQRGVPVVTTPIDGVNEILENNESGIIAESEEEAARAIIGITDTQLDIMKGNARKTVNEKYNIKSIAKSYTKLWKEEINKQNSH